MKGQKELKKLIRELFPLPLLCLGVLVDIAEIVTFIMMIRSGIWIPFAITMVVMIPVGIYMFKRTIPKYYQKVAYLCPECHTVFKPSKKEFLWANHTPSTRKLTCTCCKHKGYCIEVYDDRDDNTVMGNEGGSRI